MNEDVVGLSCDRENEDCGRVEVYDVGVVFYHVRSYYVVFDERREDENKGDAVGEKAGDFRGDGGNDEEDGDDDDVIKAVVVHN